MKCRECVYNRNNIKFGWCLWHDEEVTDNLDEEMECYQEFEVKTPEYLLGFNNGKRTTAYAIMCATGELI